MRQVFVITVLGLFASAAIADTILVENFDSVATLGAGGWALINNSSPVGSTGWFQGNPGIFTSQSGAADSYVAANFENAAFGGNISNWLLSPLLALNNGDTISFYTRSDGIFADRLEVRLSTSGASTDVGGTDASVGDFTSLLLTINPSLDPNGYPTAWTGFSAMVSGLGGSATGRYALRYFVQDTSSNANYIGIDTLAVNAVPEPGVTLILGLGLAALGLVRRARALRR